MKTASSAWRKAPWPSRRLVVGFWALAALLSSAQIYLRDRARGFETPWEEVLAANALAWLPWLAIAPAVLWLERRFPAPGSRTGRHLMIHAGAAAGISLAFLLYLAFFHAAFLDGSGSPPSWASLHSEYLEQLGRHFLVVVGLYVAIALSGFGHRTRSARRESQAAAALAAPRSLVARSVGKVERVDPSEVDWIEACGNYANLHKGERKVLIRRTLASLAEELEADGFVRVHRSAIVNVARVARLRPGSHGDATVELRGGRRVKVSRTHRRALEERL